MRLVVVLGILLAVGPSAGAAELRFEDPAGDVAPEAALAGIDIVEAGVMTAGDMLNFWLGLDGAVDAVGVSGPDLHYRLDFTTHPDHAGYSLRASHAGMEAVPGTALPVRTWSFAVQDRQTDTWTPLLGQAEDGRIEWSVEPGMVGLGDAKTVAAVWDAVAWTGLGAGAPAMDYVVTDEGFRRADGAAPGPFPGLETLEAMYARLGAWTAFTDAQGDVSEMGRPYDGAGARGADALAARLADAGDTFVIELQVDELDAIEEEREEAGFHAQYALCFTVHGGEQCMRATYRGSGMGEDGWSFQRHAVADDAWHPIHGLASGDSLIWTLPKAELEIGDGDILDDWSLQSWNSYDERGQHGDTASGFGAFVVGAHAPQIPRSLPPPDTIPLVCLSGDEGARILDDGAGDATVPVRDTVYDGPGSGIVDALGARAALQDEDLVVALDMRDLSDDTHPDDEATSVQWALGFIEDGEDRYDLRATYGVGGYWAEGWSFNVHDAERDEWPPAEGQVQGDTLVWRVPLADVGLAPGDTIDGWRLQVWSSARPDRDQIVDWAEGTEPLRIEPGAEADCSPAEEPAAGWAQVGLAAQDSPPAKADPAPQDSGGAASVEASAPGSLLVVAVGAVAVLVGRRR